MPLLHLATNVTLETDAEQRLATGLSEAAARLLGKPERYVMVVVESGLTMRFGGSDAPCAHLQLKSLGLPGDETGRLSAALCDHLAEALKLAADRIYIEFSSPERHMWGWNRTTFG